MKFGTNNFWNRFLWRLRWCDVGLFWRFRHDLLCRVSFSAKTFNLFANWRIIFHFGSRRRFASGRLFGNFWGGWTGLGWTCCGRRSVFLKKVHEIEKINSWLCIVFTGGRSCAGHLWLLVVTDSALCLYFFSHSMPLILSSNKKRVDWRQAWIFL